MPLQAVQHWPVVGFVKPDGLLVSLHFTPLTPIWKKIPSVGAADGAEVGTREGASVGVAEGWTVGTCVRTESSGRGRRVNYRWAGAGG